MGEPKRRYRSSLRAEHARATRYAVVQAASDLFVERGYAGATIDAVAERAAVSRKTVFTAVGGKPELLKLAWDWALVGDDEPLDMAARPVVAEMMAEEDPTALVARWSRFVTDIAVRIAPLHPVIAAAARTDQAIAALDEISERNLLGGADAFVTRLDQIGGLRAGWTRERAAEVAAVLMDPMPYERLVRRSGWSHEEYAAWIESVAAATFLP